MGQSPAQEQIEAWGTDWNGCKLWTHCLGRSCKGSSWRTPALLPSLSRRPPGCHTEDRRLSNCPLTIEPWIWATLSTWEAWRLLGGLPGPGSVEEQEARQVDAFGILTAELDLIQGFYQERAESRQSARR